MESVVIKVFLWELCVTSNKHVSTCPRKCILSLWSDVC